MPCGSFYLINFLRIHLSILFRCKSLSGLMNSLNFLSNGLMVISPTWLMKLLVH